MGTIAGFMSSIIFMLILNQYDFFNGIVSIIDVIVIGVIAGGLYNNDKDTSKRGIDIAFRNGVGNGREIGTPDGDANTKLKVEASKPH